MSEIKDTPFRTCHERAGAKLVEFAGYAMPIQYHSIQKEHLKVRESVGIFDLSHMGEFFVNGPGALEFLQRTNTNDVSKIEVGGVLYSAMCYDDGGIVDDLLIYRLEDGYLLVVNAANIDKDFDWLRRHKPADVELLNRSDEFGLLAIQGPKAEMVMAKLVDVDLSELPYYSWRRGMIQGRETLFSRTGYTGEDGFEIYCDPSIAEALWEAAMQAGKEFEIEPIGLGARDSLRLEMRYMLYGNDIDATTNPIEAGLAWICKLEKPEFIGREPILALKEGKPLRKLQSLVLRDKAIPRHGYKLFEDTEEVGEVTSGIFSPSLQSGIALGYVARGHGKIGNTVEIDIRGKRVAAEVIKGAFYKNGSHK
ncbi:MAG: glycine cleavage system aminomethyltransferase GcvT [bacterium]